MESWVDAVQKVGIPAGLLALMGWALYKSGMWAGDNVVKPLVSRGVTFLDKLETATERMADNLSDLTAQGVKNGQELERISRIGCGNFVPTVERESGSRQRMKLVQVDDKG